MRLITALGLPLIVSVLAGCGSEADRQADAAEDQIEQQAEASAVAAGDTVAALGLTERQLLDAELVTADGREIGDVEQVRRGANNAVEGFLVEVEDSNPDRYVMVPLEGLTVRTSGNDNDLRTTMTDDDLAALPSLEPTGAVAPAT